MSPRVRSRRARDRRFDWPLTIEQELRRGIDEEAFRSKLGRFFVRSAIQCLVDGNRAGAIEALNQAREFERALRAPVRRVREGLSEFSPVASFQQVGCGEDAPRLAYAAGQVSRRARHRYGAATPSVDRLRPATSHATRRHESNSHPTPSAMATKSSVPAADRQD